MTYRRFVLRSDGANKWIPFLLNISFRPIRSHSANAPMYVIPLTSVYNVSRHPAQMCRLPRPFPTLTFQRDGYLSSQWLVGCETICVRVSRRVTDHIYDLVSPWQKCRRLWYKRNDAKLARSRDGVFFVVCVMCTNGWSVICAGLNECVWCSCGGG